MACFGYKKINLKIGRKTYPFEIIKAQVESSIIGWDFMKKHKLDLRWNDNDEITIYDKKSQDLLSSSSQTSSNGEILSTEKPVIDLS